MKLWKNVVSRQISKIIIEIRTICHFNVLTHWSKNNVKKNSVMGNTHPVLRFYHQKWNGKQTTKELCEMRVLSMKNPKQRPPERQPMLHINCLILKSWSKQLCFPFYLGFYWCNSIHPLNFSTSASKKGKQVVRSLGVLIHCVFRTVKRPLYPVGYIFFNRHFP